jgi:hypothetical protein
MNVKEILKGTKIGTLQTVGIMQVIPLLSDIEFDGYVSPKQSGTFRNTNYGDMIFKNDSDKTMLIPNNTTYMVKQAAQDHAMMHAGIVKGKSTKWSLDERDGGRVTYGLSQTPTRDKSAVAIGRGGTHQKSFVVEKNSAIS